VIVITTRRGRDGKDYPPVMPPPRAWRYQVVVATHELVHVQGLSQRAAQCELLRRGWRRSTGSIAYDLTRPMVATCQGCAERAAADG
jgi:hypothetical protein